MQFGHTYDLVMSGVKTQTRRVQMPNEYVCNQYGLWIQDINAHTKQYGDLWDLANPYRTSDYGPGVTTGQRMKWQIGKTYAVQPGRGRKAGGRILLTGIRSERVQDITNEDALAEGMLLLPANPPIYRAANTDIYRNNPIDAYAELWDTIHTRPGERWDDDPLVFVLTFELIEGINNALA